MLKRRCANKPKADDLPSASSANAEAIAFLASDVAKHITGAILPVTGGAHLNV